MCYMKLLDGASYEEAQQFRDECYTRFAGVRQSDKRKREQQSAAATTPTKIRKADGEAAAKVPAGAVRIEGRAAGLKNSSINGMYEPLPHGTDGAVAYRKQQSGDKERFLYFHAAKSRWKVSNKLGDTAGGFAYAVVRDGGRTPIADVVEGVAWMVMDGKGSGYKEDANVRCVRLAPDRPRSEGSDAQVAAMGSGEERHPPGSSSNGSNSSSDSSRPSDTSGGGSDDDSDRESASSEEAAAAVSAAAGVPQAAAAAASAATVALQTAMPSSANGSVTTKGRTSAPTGAYRVCAKMLVRSRLRCSCHFSYVHLCPDFTRP